MVDAKTDTTVHPSSPPHPHPIIAESGRGKNGDEELVLAASSRMFNALSGLGGGGQINPKTADNANVALYSTFATTAFLSGSIVNKIGPRLSYQSGYTLFIGSYLSYNINQNSAFVIAAGAILGVCAGLLWTAQGSLMLAYATEATKGRYIASFWIIFNLGAVLGEAVALGKNYRDTTFSLEWSLYRLPNNHSNSTLLSFTLAPPSSITRTDGSIVTIERNPGWKIELKSMFKTLTQDPTILLLFPFFWASNCSLQHPHAIIKCAIVLALSIFGSGLFGLLLDFQRAFNRQQRACLGWIILTSVIFVVWGFGWMVQKDYERGSVTSKMDWSDSRYAGRVWLYIFYGPYPISKLLIPPNHQLPPPSSTTTTTFKLEKQSV
ncbi:hypothetical protein KEM48_001560 [Puccinia striiformis f. sp. tritici PST-130]|nr:hypothetical protein KEM48_001560 [Puccinia striiformis f. sp. tritici PST-130]